MCYLQYLWLFLTWVFGLKQNLLKCSLSDIGSMIEIKKGNLCKKNPVTRPKKQERHYFYKNKNESDKYFQNILLEIERDLKICWLRNSILEGEKTISFIKLLFLAQILGNTGDYWENTWYTIFYRNTLQLWKKHHFHISFTTSCI